MLIQTTAECNPHFTNYTFFHSVCVTCLLSCLFSSINCTSGIFFLRSPPSQLYCKFHNPFSNLVLNRYTPLSQSRKITRDPDSHWKQKGACMLVLAATFICGRYAEKASGLFFVCFVLFLCTILQLRIQTAQLNTNTAPECVQLLWATGYQMIRTCVNCMHFSVFLLFSKI